jgi:hypothetical protein
MKTATPVITIPPELFPMRLTPLRSSYERTLAMSSTWVARRSRDEQRGRGAFYTQIFEIERKHVAF